LGLFVIDSLLVLLVVIGLAYRLDYWIQTLLETNYRTYDIAPYLNGPTLANIALALGVLSLAWYVRFKGGREPVVGLLFLLVGLGLTLLPFLLLNFPGSGEFLSSPEIRILRAGFLYSSTISRLHFAGAFAVAIGISILLP
jgi:hypothetical protein